MIIATEKQFHKLVEMTDMIKTKNIKQQSAIAL